MYQVPLGLLDWPTIHNLAARTDIIEICNILRLSEVVGLPDIDDPLEFYIQETDRVLGVPDIDDPIESVDKAETEKEVDDE